MVPYSSPVSSAPTPTKHVPAVVTASREAKQDEPFMGNLLEGCSTVTHRTSDAQLMSDPSSSPGPEWKNTSKLQRSGKDVEAAQSETQPKDGKVAPVQTPHGHGATWTLMAKSEHGAQVSLRSAKKQENEENQADEKTILKEAPGAEGSACTTVSGYTVSVQSTSIPVASPARGVDSRTAIGHNTAAPNKNIAAAGKLTFSARDQGEPTLLPGKLHEASPAIQQAEAGKDSGEQHYVDPPAEHGAQEIVVNVLPAASPVSKPSTLESTIPSTLPIVSDPIKQLGDSRTMAATATSLEVGISSGTQGWLRVRAELDQSGTVAAAVVASSAAAAENLTRHLPAMSEFLAQETTRIGSIVVHASFASDPATNFLSNPLEWSGISNSAAGEREQRNSDHDQQLYPDSEAGLASELKADGIRSRTEFMQPVWPGLLRGQRGTGTHWVSVRV